jgi:hypothetical protein
MNISKVVKIMSLSLEREGIVIVTKRLKCFDSLVCTSSSARLIANTMSTHWRCSWKHLVLV